MKRSILLITLGLFFVVFCASLAEAKGPFSSRKNRKILPAYTGGKFNETQRLSIYISSLIDQGRISKAAQILNIMDPQIAATVMLSMRPDNARGMIKSVDTKNAKLAFVQLAKLDASFAGNLLEALTPRNRSLAAKLYKEVAREKDILMALLKATAANEKMLTSLLTAKNEKAKHIISTDDARRLLVDYAKADGRDEWGMVEIAAMINSGRGAEILFRILTRRGILEMTDKEKMKVLLSMKYEEAAKIIKNAHPYQAARLLVIMDPRQATRILAEKALKPKEVKMIINEMYKLDKDATEDLIRELKSMAPSKAEII